MVGGTIGLGFYPLRSGCGLEQGGIHKLVHMERNLRKETASS